ncbi:T9SS type A sorting domain-containing protein, partial [Bacteroidota bacterium]
CSELFFSEYIEGSGNNKGVEIYNPTNQIVVLEKYYVARYSNGNLTYDAGGLTQLVGFLQPYSTHLLVNGQTVSTGSSPACDPALQTLAQQLDHDYPAPTYMNGNDAIALFFDPVGSGSVNDFVVVDLFGIIGGGMQSNDEGWATFTDQYAYKNIYEGDVVVGKDSVYIQNYIVPDSYYWLPWSANHSLFRKPSVKQGVKANPATEFVITMEWDTVPGGNNAWDHLGEHTCDCTPASAIGTSKADPELSVYPNPTSSTLKIESEKPFSDLILMDAAGRIILRRNYPAGEQIHSINLDQTLPGVYLLRVTHEEGTFIRKVVIR